MSYHMNGGASFWIDKSGHLYQMKDAALAEKKGFKKATKEQIAASRKAAAEADKADLAKAG